MTIHFEEPPANQRVGGLDAAIRALESALNQCGCRVSSGTAAQAVRGDIVHFHGLWQPGHARLSRVLSDRGIPMLISPHGMLEPWAWRHKWWKKWPYYWLIERGHLRRAHVILATASTEAGRLRQLLTGRTVEALPLGLTDGTAQPNYPGARVTLGWNSEETVLLFLSRLHSKKGLELLLHALAAIALPAGVRLVIVGGGEPAYTKSLQDLAQRLGSSLPKIDWVGEVWGAQRWPYFQGADLFCLPSYSENFGLAVLEACQVGTPALTTNTTPWGDWLGPDRGIIVEPDVESVAGGLKAFFVQRFSPDRRSELASWTRETFSWEVLSPRYVQLYRDVAGLIHKDAKDTKE